MTVDLLSNGRFELGVGKRCRNNEFDGFGFPSEEREDAWRKTYRLSKAYGRTTVILLTENITT